MNDWIATDELLRSNRSLSYWIERKSICQVEAHVRNCYRLISWTRQKKSDLLVVQESALKWGRDLLNNGRYTGAAFLALLTGCGGGSLPVLPVQLPSTATPTPTPAPSSETNLERRDGASAIAALYFFGAGKSYSDPAEARSTRTARVTIRRTQRVFSSVYGNIPASYPDIKKSSFAIDGATNFSAGLSAPDASRVISPISHMLVFSPG